MSTFFFAQKAVEQQQHTELASTRFNTVTAELPERICQLESDLAHQKENLHTANAIACLPITNEWLLASNNMKITDGMKLASQQNGNQEKLLIKITEIFCLSKEFLSIAPFVPNVHLQCGHVRCVGAFAILRFG